VVTGVTRPPRIGVATTTPTSDEASCAPSSTTSSSHCTSPSMSCSPSGRDQAGRPGRQRLSWSAWPSPRSCWAATANGAGDGSSVTACATCSPMSPGSPATTGGCAPPRQRCGGAVASSDHPVRLPPLGHLNRADCGHDRVFRVLSWCSSWESPHSAGLSRRRRAQCNSASQAHSGCPRCSVRRTCGRLEPDDQEHDRAHLGTRVEGIKSIAQCDSTFLPTVLATSLVRCLPGR
jgi:hypothetical protein